MRSMRHLTVWALVLLVSLAAVGCSPAPDFAGEGTDPPAPTASASVQPTQEPIATPEPTPVDEPSATPEAEEPAFQATPVYTRTEVPEAGLSFELPEPWVRLEPDWVWAPEPGSDFLVGVKWLALEPPQEVEAAMLPSPSEVLSAESVVLALGTGQRFRVNVFGPAVEGSNEQASVDSMQTHILVVVDHGGSRLAYDFFAAGSDAEQLGLAESALEHLVASVNALPLVEAASTPDAAASDAGASDAGAPEAVLKAITILANHLTLAEDVIKLVDWEFVEWSDACLGIHTPGIMCAQVITPGYRITLSAGGLTYELHTNQNGSSVGIASGLLRR